MTDATSADTQLPLTPATFHVLLALADQDRHGYAILQEIEARTRGEVRLSAGTLYATIQRLLEQGLIAEVRKKAATGAEARRRCYHITPLGTAVARAETRRLAQLVRIARGAGILATETG